MDEDSLPLRADVTAVCLHKDFVLAGIGSNVIVFDKKTNKILTASRVVHEARIHGFTFCKNSNDFLVYGAKQLVLARLIGDAAWNVEIVTVHELQTSDWILHAVWTHSGTIITLTAHNVVQEWKNADTKYYQSSINKCTFCEVASYPNDDRSILYSGRLIPLWDDVLVLAGTVFSEVLVRRAHGSRTQQLIGHQGAIFWMEWSEERQLLVTTSDDRSVRIWTPDPLEHSPQSAVYWDTCTLRCRHVLYGHLSRVLRCVVTRRSVISAGEDSRLCFWDEDGRLTRQITAHGGASVWSIDADCNDVVTGGGDCGVALYPLSLSAPRLHTLPLHSVGSPKSFAYTASGNIVIQCDIALVYWRRLDDTLLPFATFPPGYRVAALSLCRRRFALADADGHLRVFLEDNDAMSEESSGNIESGVVRSLHWAGDSLVMSSDEGRATVVSSECSPRCVFALPACRERWLTAACASPSGDAYALGDRSGSLHICTRSNETPVCTVRKVHGRYGPTGVQWTHEGVVTTGRDGCVRYFAVRELEMQPLHRVETGVQWVERMLDDSLIIGFSGREFVVQDVKQSRSLLRVSCGGGHRAWDLRTHTTMTEDMLQFAYVKESTLHELSYRKRDLSSTTLLPGTHAGTVNCAAAIRVSSGETFLVSGGEDTAVRVAALRGKTAEDRVVLKQAESVRAISSTPLDNGRFLVATGGGRAALRLRTLHISNGRTSVSEGAETRAAATDMPDTRVMGVAVVFDTDAWLVAAACSDSVLRVYRTDRTGGRLEVRGETSARGACLLAVHSLECDGTRALLTTSSDGELCAWNLAGSLSQPAYATRLGRAGVNALHARSSESGWLVCAGSDDGSISLLRMEGWKERDRWRGVWHSAQVSGVHLPTRTTLLAVGGDQRVSIGLVDELSELSCRLVRQLYTDVPDPHGLCLVSQHRFDETGEKAREQLREAQEEEEYSSVEVMIFGKGFQLLKVELPG